jgi:hypothetical protein
MNVDSFVLSGDLYGYENSSNTVLKSDYGVFVFAREGELEGFSGYIKPYMVELLEGEELIEKGVEIDAYCTEDHICVPLYESSNFEPNHTFVFDGEFAVSFGGFVEADPRVLGHDSESEQFVEVYPNVLGNRHFENRYPKYVSRDDVRDVFTGTEVERVFVV